MGRLALVPQTLACVGPGQGAGKMCLLVPSGGSGPSHTRSAETGPLVEDCLASDYAVLYCRL